MHYSLQPYQREQVGLFAATHFDKFSMRFLHEYLRALGQTQVIALNLEIVHQRFDLLSR